MRVTRSRREQYSEATRAAILEAATRRFATDGFTATGLEDIAGDIQATRGAVYHHFASKRAVFEAVLEEQEIAAITRTRAAQARESDPWRGALAAMNEFLDLCLDPVYRRIAWLEGPIALGWSAWQAAEEKYAYAHIEEVLTGLVSAGLLDPLPVGTATHICFTVLGSAGMALAQAAPEDRERLRAEYADVLGRMISGLRTRAG
ncbi:TetR/AcrR family transcriptional regulator [Actinokineospora soli]|uniref:TetR/AcrR family transcriptional regulator n=1 Tax=Actinokineospora soli TaxID=1048753 RepID=A0ABW2TJU5_9PSEU